MNDEELAILWSEWEPTARQSRRMEAHVTAALDAHDTSLLAEWLALVDIGPWHAIGLVTASVVSVATTVPLLLVARLVW